MGQLKHYTYIRVCVCVFVFILLCLWIFFGLAAYVHVCGKD